MLSNTETVASLLNGMIGGTILVLPLLALRTGYIAAILIAIGMGLASVYTARLITLHMGDCKSVNECLVRHFGQSIIVRVLYNGAVVVGIIPTLMAYFRLIVMQLEGLFGTQHKNILAIAALLTMAIAIVVIRFYDWGQKLMGYGIVSIISYVIFMLWAQVTAPRPKGSVPLAFGQGYSQLAISLMMAYSIHDVMVQIIVRNPNKKILRSLMGLVFLLGGIIYCYIAIGCFGKSISIQPFMHGFQLSEILKQSLTTFRTAVCL